MYSFEGNFRKRPVQSLGGASKKVKSRLSFCSVVENNLEKEISRIVKNDNAKF